MQRTTAATYWLLVLALAAAAPRADAQATVELKIAGRDLYVREAVDVHIEIRDFQTCEPPEPPALPNAVLRQRGESSDMMQTSIINGRMTQSRSRTYAYELTPLAVGELVVPPIPVKVDGRVLTTRAVTLTVSPSDADQLFAVDVTTGRSRLYVGQRVPLSMTIWLKPARYRGRLLQIDEMIQMIRPIRFGPFPLPARPTASRRPLPGGDPSEPYYAYEFVTTFIPERPGPLALDIEAGIEYPMHTGARNLRAQANVEPAEVLPVPMDGRPAAFAGAVGLFAIEAAAKPTSVRVGDPIELTIEVFGDGPVETLPPPLLSENEPLNLGFRVPGEPLAGEMQDGRRRFRLTVRAKRDDVAEIPAIEYPYFDPDAERFVVARSKPIPLAVAPAAEVALLEIAGPRGETPGSAASTLQTLDGLRDIETSESALLAQVAPITPGAVASVMFVPPAAFAVLWIGATCIHRRTADPARRRRQSALRTARRRIGRARDSLRGAAQAGGAAGPSQLPAEIAAALTGYLADRCNEPPARFTGLSAVEFLRQRGVGADLAARWADLVQRCEEASFAGGVPADGDALVRQALECLGALERQKL